MDASEVLRKDGGCTLMGVVNLSSESFYRGSYYPPSDISDVVEHMVAQGADIVDVGGRSTAPNAAQISVQEELRRVKEALSLLEVEDGAFISVDTQYAEVAREALHLGAHIVNDVSGLSCDSALAEVVREWGCPVVLMASCVRRGDGLGLSHSFRCAEKTVERALEFGVKKKNIILDPAVGKWIPEKQPSHDLELLNGLEHFKQLGFPLLVGVSRKSFIGEVLGLTAPERLYGSLGAAAIAVYKGADIIRTHDVRETLHAVRIAEAIRSG